VPFAKPVAQAVLQHHERLDGSGYPNGATDEEIILEARILAVADVAEAMSSHRPYRPALSPGSAVVELAARRGTLYDRAVVDAFLQLPVELQDPGLGDPNTGQPRFDP
jgi:HD-GYP domain-containing protein (c-di-GMP phosphodiesterase class II)